MRKKSHAISLIQALRMLKKPIRFYCKRKARNCLTDKSFCFIQSFAQQSYLNS